MVFAWIFLLIAAMVHTRETNKLKRAKKKQKEGEYVSLDESESESETEFEDWEKYAEEVEAKTLAASKGKAPASSRAKTTPTAEEKGKAPLEATPMKKKCVAKKRGRGHGIKINEPPSESIFQVNSERIKDFEKRECIGERHVNVKALKERSTVFGALFDRTGLAPICNFLETTGYCLHLVRTFYQNASGLVDLEDGSREFVTTVRNVKLKITPQVIGEVLGMDARAEGIHYLKGHEFTNTTWRKVVDGIFYPTLCLLETPFSPKNFERSTDF